ncbi:AT7L3 protein, partial [Glareola pratincola]|nr:AT7L3 protein [Glareola pratincola]
QAIAHEIYTDLVEDACLGLCFEVHRAVKCGYFFLDDTDPDSMKDFEIVDQPGVDIFGQVYNQWKNKECVCPNCNRSIAASRFAPHLEKCLGMGRNSSRIANRRIASSNNMNKSESDQEDNDDINDNDWSYGSEKKGEGTRATRSQPGRGSHGPPLRGGGHVPPALWPLNPAPSHSGCGGSPECPGPHRSWGTHTQSKVPDSAPASSSRSLRCPQHTDEQRRSVRVYLLGPSASLPEAEGSVENDSFEVAESQAIMSRLQWDGSSDISPSDSASSKASEYWGGGADPAAQSSPGGGTNNSESRKTKKKKPHLGLVSGAPGLGSSKKKKPKPPAPHTPSIYDDIN